MYDQFSEMISSKTHFVPSKTIENLVQISGGSDLLRALVAADIRTINLLETKRTALIIPVPDMKRFNPKPAFGESTVIHTWALVHWNSLPGATATLMEGLTRPADWEHNDDPRCSQLPTFGLFGIGTEISRGDTEIPSWAEASLLDRASKKGKGQLPVLISAPFIVAPNNMWL